MPVQRHLVGSNLCRWLWSVACLVTNFLLAERSDDFMLRISTALNGTEPLEKGLILPVLRVSSVRNIPPLLHIHVHLLVPLTGRTSG